MKRGETYTMVPWLTRLMLMVVATVVIALLVRYYTNHDVQDAEVSKQALAYRLYYSDIIMYSDEATKRVYPGIIDLQHFTDDRLQKYFLPSQRGVPTLAACLRLQDKELKTICTDKTGFDRYINQAKADWEGPGGATLLVQRYPVSIKDGAQERPGTLEIIVVRSNS